jgi:hypothetical protein
MRLDAYRRWVAAVPENPWALNAYARDLAQCEEKSLRDPKKAIELATRACTSTKRRAPVMLAGLAIAYQADGRLKSALEMKEAAILAIPAKASESQHKEITSALADIK